jgi:hypothetical protein
MKKVLSTILLATLVLSVVAVAGVVPVRAAVEGQLTTSSIGNKIYKDQYVEIRVIDNDLNAAPTGYDAAQIKIELIDKTGAVNETVYPYANETFVNSGEFVIYLIVSSSYSGNTNITGIANVTVKPGTLPYYNAVVYNSSFVKDDWTFRITYPEAGSTPKTVTLTYYDDYKTTNADLSLDRPGDTPAYPFYGGSFKLYIKDYNLNSDPTKKDTVNLNITMTDIVSPTINDTEIISFTETDINTGVFVATINYVNASGDTAGKFELLNPNTNSPIKVEYTNESSYTQLKFVKYSRTLDVASTFTISGDLLIRIIDNNENVRSWAADDISGFVNVSVGSDYEVILGAGNFTETGADTGVFEYTLPVTIGAQSVNNTKLEFAAGTYTSTVNVQYKDAAGNLLASTTTKLATTTASITSDKDMYKPTDTAVLTLTAPDLNLDSSYNIYTISVSQYQLINNIQVSVGAQNVGNFSVKVNDGYANVTDPSGLTLNFVETGTNTGVFTANLPLSKIKTAAGGALTDGDTIQVIWYDLINNAKTSATFTIGVPASSVTLDRTSYPAPKDGPVKVKVTVYDPDAGTSSVIDTLSNAINVTVYYANGTQVPGTTGLFSLVETGPATYTFTYTYTLAQYPSPDIIGGTIKVMYTDSSANKLVNATADIKNTDASLAANVTSASPGTAIKFTLNDPDANRDPTTPETPSVSVEYTPAGSTSTTTTTWNFAETDKSTGVFTYTVTIGKDLLVAPGSTIKLTYVDTTPSFITNQMSSYSNQSYTVTVSVPSFSGSITTDKDEYGPFTNITVRVVDPDLNTDITTKNSVTISYKKSGVAGSFPLTLTETDVNTGIFEGTLPTAVADIGKSIQFFYLDEKDASGNSVYVSKTVTVAAKTGTIEFDKAYYNVGDLATIKITDNDLNTDSTTKQQISVTVTSTSDPIGTTATAIETDVNTGVFSVTIQISSSLGQAGKIYAKVGDTLYAEYSDTYPSTYSSTNTTAQTVKTSATVGVPVARPVPASSQKFVDPNTGAEKTSGTVGQAIGLQATVKNVDVVSKTFTAIFKVKDASGVTISISWVTGTLAPGQELTPGVSWTPSAAGTYTVEVLVVKTLAEPTPYSDIQTKTLTVS